MCDNMPLSKAYDEYTIEDIYNLPAGKWTITVWDLRNDNNYEIPRLNMSHGMGIFKFGMRLLLYN